jgi:hypothetical protein
VSGGLGGPNIRDIGAARGVWRVPAGGETRRHHYLAEEKPQTAQNTPRGRGRQQTAGDRGGRGEVAKNVVENREPTKKVVAI